MKANEILVFDTETTGLPQYHEPSGGENQPHLVQLAAHVFDVKNATIAQTMDVIIKPGGWVIPEEVTAIHGISTEYAGDTGVSEKLALEMFMDLWRGRTQVAHNVNFDRRIIRIGLKRYFSDLIADEFKAGVYECTGLLAKPIMQMPPKGRYGYKMPKLAEAYRHFCGKELENAHTAIADVNACLEVYLAIMQIPAEAA